MDGRTACRCVTARARAVSTGTHVWEGMVSEHHSTQVQHLTTATASAATIAVHDYDIQTPPWIWAGRLNLRRLLFTNGLEPPEIFGVAGAPAPTLRIVHRRGSLVASSLVSRATLPGHF